MRHYTRNILILVLAAGSFLYSKEIPNHPGQLSFDSLQWQIPIGTPYRMDLKNGLRVYIAEDPLLPIVKITGYVKYGSLADPKGKEGLGSLMATLMRNGGTTSYPADTLDALLDQLAMRFGFSLAETALTFNVSFLAEYTDTALKVLEQMLFHPAFDKKKLEKEKKIYNEDIRHRFDNPGPALDAGFQKIMYPGQSASTLITSRSLENITRQDLVQLHKRIFTTNNTILAAAGAFKRKAMISRLESIFPPSGVKAADSIFPSVRPDQATRALIIHKPITQAYVRFGLPLFKRPHPDYYAMSILNMIVGGGGFTSRLGTKVRSDAGLTYSIHSQAESNYFYPGTFYVEFFTKTEAFSKATDLALSEIQKIILENVTDREIADAKDVLIGELPSMFRSPYDIVSTYAWNEYYGRSPDHFRVYPDQLRKITREEIGRVAKKHLDVKNFSYTVVADTAVLKKAVDGDSTFSIFKIVPQKTITVDSLTSLR